MAQCAPVPFKAANRIVSTGIPLDYKEHQILVPLLKHLDLEPCLVCRIDSTQRIRRIRRRRRRRRIIRRRRGKWKMKRKIEDEEQKSQKKKK